MKTKEITENQINYHYQNLLSSLIPIGSLDLRRAIEVALEVNEDSDWVADKIGELQEMMDYYDLSKIDPVYAVYEAILQESRNEIDELTSFDFCNDGAEVYTCDNCLATSYDWSDNANEIIKEKLVESGITFDDLSTKTQWFLEQIEVDY